MKQKLNEIKIKLLFLLKNKWGLGIGIILNLNISYQNLELGKNYIYDGNKNSNSILKIDNLNKTLLKNNPYMGLFIKLD